jgi:hypothetical protein
MCVNVRVILCCFVCSFKNGWRCGVVAAVCAAEVAMVRLASGSVMSVEVQSNETLAALSARLGLPVADVSFFPGQTCCALVTTY